MKYKLKHKKTGLFYGSLKRKNGIKSNLSTEGSVYSFKPTAKGRGYSYLDRDGSRWLMKENQWEAVEALDESPGAIQPVERHFIMAFSDLCFRAYSNALDKGFWSDKLNLIAGSSPWSEESIRRATISQELMLMVTELGEAMEGVRNGNPPDDKIPEFSALEAELADVVIRIAGMAGGRDLRIAEAIVAKMKFNAGRERLHGKKC